MLDELNLNYYRPAYIKDFIRSTTDLITDTNKIGDLCGSIWGYYNPFDPANAPIRNKPLDPSIYLWYVGQSSAGSNACLSVAPSETLSVEVKVNSPTSVPLAMCFYSLTDTDGGLRKDPKVRLAYDETTWDGWNGKFGGWQNSELFYNINPLKYCLYPTISVFDFSTNSVNTSRTLENMAAYINNNEEKRRVCLIRSNLYCGDTPPRTISGMYTPAATVGGLDVGILTDRPVCDNLANTVGAWIRDGEGHENYDISKVYNPFNQGLTQLWYDDINAYQTDVARQMDIGYYRSATRETFIQGRYNVPNSHGKCTAEFCKINFERKDFDDVSYQWRHCTYYGEVGAEIENGFPLLNYGSANSNIKTLSILEILDTKGLTYGEACKRAVLHELAYYGFWIAETATKAANDPLGTTTTGNGVYLPEKIGGVTTGRYFTGEDIKDVPYACATDTIPFKYSPELSPEEEVGENNTIVNSGTIGSGATYYALTNTEMNELSTWLNTTYEPTDQDTFIQDFKGTDPANYITTVMYYPFDIPLDSGADMPVVVGKLTAGGATGRLLYYKYGDLYNFGSYTVPKRGDWLDYLCKTTVFIPFCGTVDLDPIMWAGHTLTVKMAIDWPTGVCTAFLYRDNGMIDSLSGSVGVPLPLSSVANGSYQVAITNLLASHKAAHRGMITGALGIAGGAATAIGGAAGFNPKLAVGGILAMASGATAIDSNSDKMENIEYNIDHTQPRVTEVSGGSPFINCGTDYRVKILRTEPLMMSGYNAAVYGHTIGFADCRNVPNLANISGFVQCTNIDTNGLGVPAHLIKLLNIACQEGLIV